MRGRRPKPTQLKVITGNPGKRRLNKSEPKPDASELPPCPPELTGLAQTKWFQLSRELHRIGLLSKIDVDALANYCVAYKRKADADRVLREIEAKGDATSGLLVQGPDGRIKENPLIKISRDASQLMLKIAVEFGMTPSARSRVAADAGKNAPGGAVVNDDDAEAADYFGD